MSTPVNLLDFDRAGLKTYFTELGEPAYRALQVFKWIHQQGVVDFQAMSNISKDLRIKLQDSAQIRLPEIAYHQKSADGTVKWLMRLSCGNCVETVFIPEDDRGTLCVSSQVGCALNCTFCATGKQGFNRDLTIGEIIGQVWIASRECKVTNVVMMGMGEPLLNFDNVVAAMAIMLDDDAYGLSKRRVTLSTSGIIPAMKKLREVSPVALAVSLHAPNDELRDVLVPINKKYPLKELMQVCREYFRDEPRRVVTFEYVMLDGVNDSDEHARQLVKWLRDVPSKMNLIPYNAIPNSPYVCSSAQRIDRFRDILIAAGINTITRKTRGADIAAACGQLVGKVADKTSRSSRIAKQLLAQEAHQ